ncbi:MAG TPA: VWA domain-containing protein [Anaeromyxobacteraceae bacterium]|nr:VWA domain-containing protein [Anaeromyxobacteraceae bacterium]
MTGGGGHLASNVVHFARALRAAGLPVGTGRVKDALDAVSEVGLAREDFYWALHATLVSRADHRPVFDEAFRLFWRPPGAPAIPSPGPLEAAARSPERERAQVTRRVAEALAGLRPPPPAVPGRTEIDAFLAWSDREALRTKDFEQMSAEELREAERAISALRLPLRDVPTRRLAPDPRGDRIDPRATLRAALRAGSAAIPLRFRSAARRPPAVVLLCDVSGSMSRYARILLRFAHALARDRPRVHAFTFGTRLTPVTRWLRGRDPDQALAAVGRTVKDWDGGTRIGACLREFNLAWSRRLLAQGAVVLLVTDGLDRDDARGLAAETARLRRSCRRLVWLNPLLRYAGFEPRAAGIRAMLPNVDDFRPVHDLESLAQLARALGGAGRRLTA